jgi:uncharacterized membrane protein YedE/YeeE
MSATTGTHDERTSMGPAAGAARRPPAGAALGSSDAPPSRSTAVKANAVAFVSGIVFALGLGLAGMTRPSKILAFLDVAGPWDPSLAFVMVGAIGVHFVSVRVARRASSPSLAPRFAWPLEKGIDGRLLLGAALFGIGWGLAGYCPGPSLVSLASLGPGVLLFVAAMAVGTFVAGKLDRA